MKRDQTVRMALAVPVFAAWLAFEGIGWAAKWLGDWTLRTAQAIAGVK